MNENRQQQHGGGQSRQPNEQQDRGGKSRDNNRSGSDSNR